MTISEVQARKEKKKKGGGEPSGRLPCPFARNGEGKKRKTTCAPTVPDFRGPSKKRGKKKKEGGGGRTPVENKKPLRTYAHVSLKEKKKKKKKKKEKKRGKEGGTKPSESLDFPRYNEKKRKKKGREKGAKLAYVIFFFLHGKKKKKKRGTRRKKKKGETFHHAFPGHGNGLGRPL